MPRPLMRGVRRLRGVQEMETTRVLQKRAEQGEIDALFRLGYRLAYGRSRPRPKD
jgi:hypothetical protein